MRGEPTPREGARERDDRAALTDEPRRHPVYMTLVAVAALGTVPFLFVGGEPRPLLGVPLWLWSSAFFTLALSALTAWGIQRYWHDAEPTDSNDE